MPNVTQAEFARIMGVDRSTVTRTWKQPGRLVMVGELVDVEASKTRIAETADPTRADVAARHAAARNGKGKDANKPAASQPAAPAAASTADEEEEENGGSMSYQAARAVKEKYMALKARADYEQQIGNLIAREDVETALVFVGSTFRGLTDVMPDQLAPVLAPGMSVDDAHAALADAVRDLQQRFAEAVTKLAETMAREGA